MIPLHLKIGMAVVLLMAVFAAGYSVGDTYAKASAQKERIRQLHAQQEAIEAAQASYIERLQRQQISATKTIQSLENERDQIRSFARSAGGLRISADVCSNALPTSTSSTGRADETSARTVELPESIAGGLRSIAEDADQVSAQLRAMIQWVGESCSKFER